MSVQETGCLVKVDCIIEVTANIGLHVCAFLNYKIQDLINKITEYKTSIMLE